jgi:rfaE bifunctional protein nucleotidyltransferase chain/domain|tara:strand:- start:2441 stop:2917 length:477 start_codon:yes stop_codon:yes gene_type:complete
MNHSKIVDTCTIMHHFAVGGKKMAFTNGCFDMFHAGHAHLLRSIKEDLPDDYELVVGVNGDESIKKNKGPERPIISQEQRAFLVACHECVDYVFVFNEATVSGYLRRFKPSRWYKGGDYSVTTLHPAEKAECGQAEVYFIPFSEDISATKIIDKIKEL